MRLDGRDAATTVAHTFAGDCSYLWPRKGSSIVIPNLGEHFIFYSSHATWARRQTSLLKVAFLLIVALGAMLQVCQAQTYHVIYTFTGGQDGAYPSTGLTIDNAGDIYGTAFGGGANHYGTVFSLHESGGNWTLSPLYAFAAGNDGAGPSARLVIGTDGSLYGSTAAGGGGPCVLSNGYRGCGTVYKLRPPGRDPGTGIFSWSASLLYRFSNTNGSYPQGELAFDSAGDIYGTTANGGAGFGLIYKLVYSGSSWTQSILYEPHPNHDGTYPLGGVIFDNSGNLYGIFSQDGLYGYGAVYELSPSGSGWAERVLHNFSFNGSDGAYPQGGLIFDNSGNLMGSAVHDPNGGGNVLELERSGGGWSYNEVYGLSGGIGLGPYDKLTMDSAGNLYGTTYGDGRYGYGSVFKLTHSRGGWTYTTLHDFAGGSDGSNPMCRLVFDSSGNLYGTAVGGGAHHDGIIFRITP